MVAAWLFQCGFETHPCRKFHTYSCSCPWNIVYQRCWLCKNTCLPPSTIDLDLVHLSRLGEKWNWCSDSILFRLHPQPVTSHSKLTQCTQPICWNLGLFRDSSPLSWWSRLVLWRSNPLYCCWGILLGESQYSTNEGEKCEDCQSHLEVCTRNCPQLKCCQLTLSTKRPTSSHELGLDDSRVTSQSVLVVHINL